MMNECTYFKGFWDKLKTGTQNHSTHAKKLSYRCVPSEREKGPRLSSTYTIACDPFFLLTVYRFFYIYIYYKVYYFAYACMLLSNTHLCEFYFRQQCQRILGHILRKIRFVRIAFQKYKLSYLS